MSKPGQICLEPSRTLSEAQTIHQKRACLSGFHGQLNRVAEKRDDFSVVLKGRCGGGEVELWGRSDVSGKRDLDCEATSERKTLGGELARLQG